MTYAYQPPRFDAAIDLDLSRNEGRPRIDRLPLEPEALAEVTSRYPDTTGLRQAVANRHGLAGDRVLVTAGGDDALFRCMLANAGSKVVATTPSFEMIRRYADQVGSPLVEVPWWDGDFPVDDFIGGSGAAIAVVVSPNNPTGNVVTSADVRKVAAEFEMVVLDGAYMEFADQDLTDEALELDNVVVIRTLSKAFGLAGLRVGYLLGPAEDVERLSAFGSPYSMSGLSAALATGILEEGLDRGFIAEISRERAALATLLDDLGMRPMPSQANFVLATDVDPGWLVPAAASLGVGLRRLDDRPELSRSVRIGLPGDPAWFERLEHTLRTIVQPDALLFDIDGVIADATGLSRLATRMPLAIVSARPRKEAQDLLDRSGIAENFSAVVAREDAPSKPDPAPVRLALERLGVSRAWMVGNTVEGLSAARGAGVLPIGVAGPGDDRSALAGAARIIESVNEIEEVLDGTQS